jgi:SagB-type dehydrogenase family enzyme
MAAEDQQASLTGIEAVHRYHDGTKHEFGRFARSLGYLDWASQPRPFRAFEGTAQYPLYPAPGVPDHGYRPRAITYSQLLDQRPAALQPTAATIGDLLRHALGLSAWKQFGQSRWSLRVNPSSGNLHPTEAYVVCGPMAGLSASAGVYHYAPDRHALEQRCAFDPSAWDRGADGGGPVLVVLTSIHWREAWKYGERAFRYCQHDLGHAIAALSIAASLVGWKAALLSSWPHEAVGQIAGVTRTEDFEDAEVEEPGCVIALTPPGVRHVPPEPVHIVPAVVAGRWSGRASQLSDDHVQWTFIDEAAKATREENARERPEVRATHDDRLSIPITNAADTDARELIRQRRSAVAFDGHSILDARAFFEMLRRVMPSEQAPWDALWWTPRLHLALFVHRVNDVAPGLYLLARDRRKVETLRAACGREFLWEPAHDTLPFYCLARGDCRTLARRVSCDQDIAADGFFSLGMIAEFDASLAADGAPFYRNLFWESGVIGQSLYLEAEAVGARATGIGCFYDNPVHDILGLQGRAFQSLYHFTVGMPVEDTRLTTEPGYSWERSEEPGRA